ncbi:hypothetical protein VNI00_000470 [Paramarasmius palmivorus]|uniref:Protein kinase domain-containing protein n=1 Tax=Paramarasmius palmivorus TaxID=297713 RepID=A0AAW0E6C6_9AGAR
MDRPNTPPRTTVNPSPADPFQETPKYMPKSHQDYGPEVRMATVRDSVMEDIGPTIPQVTFEYFLSSCLPHVNEEVVSKVYASLEKKGLVTDKGWTTMKYDELRKRQAEQRKERQRKEKEREGDGPRSSSGDEVARSANEAPDSAGQAKGTIHEDDFFNPLADCFNAVLEEANDVVAKDDHWQQPLFKFCSKHRSSTASEGTHGRYKSDVYALLNESRAVTEEGKDDAECNVILPGEYKKIDTWEKRKENIRQLVGAANHIMAYDPTRRFIFGITIEHTSIRFWFFSRSHVFVTESVDLQKEAKKVISFILALGSATLHELGFDLSMERVLSNEKIRYRFWVGGKKYEMTKLVSHSKAKFLLGRVPRVFRVKLVLDDDSLGDEEFILKDYYIPEDAKTEKEVLDDIYNKINKVNPVEGLSREEFHRYFVQIEDCERVQVPATRDRNKLVDDNTSNFLRQPFPDDSPRYVLIPSPPYETKSGTPMSRSSLATRTPGPYSLGTVSSRAQLCAIVREYYGRKVHCRLLMKDAGSTLDDVTDLPTLVKCLRQVVKALQYLYSAGYVHRDISTGNILFRYGANGEIVARLCDLEYAKDISQPGEPNRDVKTGTPHFIAVEVENADFLFKPTLGLSVSSQHPAAIARRMAPGHKISNKVATKFKFNYLHDLESVWWIIVYTLFSNIPEDMNLEGDALKAHYAIRGLIFPHPSITKAREIFLVNNDTREEQIRILPEPYFDVGTVTHLFGNYLLEQYRTLESLPNFPAGSCFSHLHPVIMSYLDDEVVEITFGGKLRKIPPKPVENPPPTTGGKRKINETEDAEAMGSSSKREKR